MKLTIFVIVVLAVVALLATRLGGGQRARNAIFHPGYGCCGRCERTWDLVRGHSTPYGDAEWWVSGPATNDVFQVVGWDDAIAFNEKGERLMVVKDGMSMFPLCEGCWSKLTPKQRLPFYRELWDKYDRTGEDWARLEKNVLAGM